MYRTSACIQVVEDIEDQSNCREIFHDQTSLQSYLTTNMSYHLDLSSDRSSPGWFGHEVKLVSSVTFAPLHSSVTRKLLASDGIGHVKSLRSPMDWTILRSSSQRDIHPSGRRRQVTSGERAGRTRSTRGPRHDVSPARLSARSAWPSSA